MTTPSPLHSTLALLARLESLSNSYAFSSDGDESARPDGSAAANEDETTSEGLEEAWTEIAQLLGLIGDSLREGQSALDRS
jgi:hypothetical protein